MTTRSTIWSRIGAVIAIAGWMIAGSCAWAVEFPGPAPGKADARLEGNRLVLENAVLKAVWNVGDGPFRFVEIVDKLAKNTLRAGDHLQAGLLVRLFEGTRFKAGQVRLAGKPVLERVEAEPNALPASRRFAGWRATVPTVCGEQGQVSMVWHLTIRDGANYVQQEATIRSEFPPLEFSILRVNAKGARVAGDVPGSPVVAKNFFLSCESPLADNSIRESDGCVTCSLRQYARLRLNEPWTVSAVIGVVPEGQLRRGFLCYLERERAQPYKPVLHCNGWTVVHWLEPERGKGEFIDLINAVGHELTEKRGVPVDTYLSDGGWDDFSTVWAMNPAFPDGLAPLVSLTGKYGGGVGIWIGPTGGYNAVARVPRQRAGFQQGMEMTESEKMRRGIFSLAGTNYYARFHQVCTDMVEKQKVNHIKFDGLGDHAWTGSELHARESDAQLRLLADLRRIKPDLYLYQMNGDWGSPYWLWTVDSVWRGGKDILYHGEGTKRQQWITGTDVAAYKKTGQAAPLLPLCCLKYHSIWVADTEEGGYKGRPISAQENDVIDDIHFSFGTGKSLLEFFIDPKMMTSKTWDALAETGRWCRDNADVLVDTHWVGGDPEKLQVYGFASWSPRKGIVSVRNPSTKPASYTVDVAKAFELPQGAATRYTMRRLWEPQKPGETVALEAGRPHTFELAPFEVLAFEAIPAK